MVEIPTTHPSLFSAEPTLYVVAFLTKLGTSGRRLGQLQDICGDYPVPANTSEVCEQTFLTASERGGQRASATYCDMSVLVESIGAGQKFSQERPSERPRAAAPEEGFAD